MILVSKQEPGKEVWIDGRKSVNRTIIRNFRIYPGDDTLLDYIAETLGTSKSDALRTAIRTQASLLAQMEKRP